MKHKIIAILAITANVLAAHAQNYCEIKGSYKGSAEVKPVYLFRTTLGRPDTVAMSIPAKDGSFGFLFEPEQNGFYSVGNKVFTHRLFFKPGDKANITLTDTLLSLTGYNTKENTILYEWEKKYRWLHRMAVYFWLKGNYTYKQIFPELEKVSKQGEQLLKTINTGNPAFDKLLKKTVAFDIDYAALMIISTPRSAHPKEEEYSDIIKNISKSTLYDNDDILQQPYGVSMLNILAMHRAITLKYSNKDFDAVVSTFKGNLSKAELVINRAERLKNYKDFSELESKYGNLFTLKDQKDRISSVRSKLQVYKEGTPGYNFTYPDSTGKTHSLTDYKGNVVLIDVWATWCGPCKKEIPALSNLEKQYHNSKVAFISISVDEKKDYEKWKKFVAEHGMSGVQLFAEGWSRITKDYKITGIPRFMLFDKEGKIISVDAPRPSDPDLTKMIDEQLAK